MPDRRHLWRGIHDPDMVKSGVEISVTTDRPRYRPGDELSATIVIKNIGVGHHFPTYVTPRVVVRATLLDAKGTPVAGSHHEYVIAREVTLDLSREVFDTRIPPGERASFSYRRRVEQSGVTLRVTVNVFPDHFYERFFKSLLATGAGTGASQIHKALEAARRSPFDIFSRDLPIS
jgi:hypothetical protein